MCFLNIYLLNLQTTLKADIFNNTFFENSKSTNTYWQPRIYLVGQLQTATAHLHIGDYYYVFANAVEAFDVCFKSFHALNVEYPAVIKFVWLLVQEGLYGISKASDKNSSAVATLVKEFNF